MDSFNGFPEAGLQFLADLRDNNDRAWFNPRKAQFKRDLQTHAIAFVEALGARLQSISPGINFDTRTNGAGSLMRIYRDTRFSNDKTPYKTNIGIVFWEGAGKKTEVPGFYFHLSPDETWIGGGLYVFPRDVLTAYRQAVDDDSSSNALAEAIHAVEAAGYPVQGEMYKRVPREYDADHPRADLLRYKGMFTTSGQIARAVVTSPELVDVCFAHCQAIAPLQQWFVRYVTG